MALCPECKKQELQSDEKVCPHCSNRQTDWWVKVGLGTVGTAAIAIVSAVFFGKSGNRS